MAEGLLDWIKTPEGQGLLSAAFGGLAGARKGAPLNSIGNAGMSGLLGYANAQDRATVGADQAFKAEQQSRARKDWTTADQIQALAPQFMTPGQPGAAANTGRFDAAGYGNALMGLDPAKGIAFQQSMAKDTPFNKLDVKDFTPDSVKAFSSDGGRNYSILQPRAKMEVNSATGQVYDPYGVKPGTVMADPNKPFSVNADGGAVPNMPFQKFQLDKAAKGATNVSVKTDVKTGESLAAQVGPMMKDSTSIAEGAVKQVDAAQRIVKAIDTDKLYAGPGAGVRMKVGQVSQMMGIGGKDEAEKIANTRSAVRGLAELTLQGRQQMKGQGAITESEGALAEKAMSGSVEDLTAAEIKQLAKASERAARFNYSEHNRKLKVMQGNSALQGIAPFYQGPEMPSDSSIGAPVAETPASAPVNFKWVNGKLVKAN